MYYSMHLPYYGAIMHIPPVPKSLNDEFRIRLQIAPPPVEQFLCHACAIMQSRYAKLKKNRDCCSVELGMCMKVVETTLTGLSGLLRSHCS